jgi:tetratricopeptide (TPR) repeat protein
LIRTSSRPGTITLWVAMSIAAPALAQPQPQSPPQQAGKVDAKSLMQSGLKLFDAKDYLGALAVFRDAYARFSSAKILLNIGTTQVLLDRKADAANSYQKYLDSADADPAKKGDVAAQIAELDKASGVLELAITPGDAEILLDDNWVTASSVKLWRVVPGTYVIKARKTGYRPAEKQNAIQAGAKQEVAFALDKLPEQKQIVVVENPAQPEGPRSRIGATVFAHVSVLPKLGSALFVGGTADITEQLAVDATLILGPGLVNADGSATMKPPKFGIYAGAKFALPIGDKLHPLVSAGFPVFFDSGARLFARLAAGAELVANRNLSFVIEIGAEYGFNQADDIDHFALVPSIGATGRL